MKNIQKFHYTAAILSILLTFITGQESLCADTPRAKLSFDAGWSFIKGDPKGADAQAFDHSEWRQLDLPHDWSIEGPFLESHASGVKGGYLPCGTGWYRKSFKLPTDAAGIISYSISHGSTGGGCSYGHIGTVASYA